MGVIMIVRAPYSLLALAAAGALAACSSGPLPETATSAPMMPAVVTPQTVMVPAGTLVTSPGAVTVVPNSGSSVAVTRTRLTGTEIASLLSDNTASGTTSDGQPYWVHFNRDGTLNYRQSTNYSDSGTWQATADGRLCSRLAHVNSGVGECYTLYRSGAQYVYDNPDGRPVGSFTISPG
jgi:hypothetical protein